MGLRFALTYYHANRDEIEAAIAAEKEVARQLGQQVVFRAEASNAPTFLKWLPELKTVEVLTTLANFRCYVRPLVQGSPQPVCTLYTYADPPVPDSEQELQTERRGEPEPLPPHYETKAFVAKVIG